MRSARLNTKIAIQSVTKTTNSRGVSVESWSDVDGAPQWAEYIPLRGDETLEMAKVTANKVFKLRIRRWADLSRRHRVQVGSDYANIKDIQDYTRRNEMIVWCEVVE